MLGKRLKEALGIVRPRKCLMFGAVPLSSSTGKYEPQTGTGSVIEMV